MWEGIGSIFDQLEIEFQEKVTTGCPFHPNETIDCINEITIPNVPEADQIHLAMLKSWHTIGEQMNCMGPGRQSKKNISKWPQMLALFTRGGCVLDIELVKNFQGKRLVLRGCTCNDTSHFVTWVRHGDWEWIFLME